jgi:hypothetical protein
MKMGNIASRGAVMQGPISASIFKTAKVCDVALRFIVEEPAASPL